MLCLYLVNICLIFSILYMLYRSVMSRRTPDSRRDRDRLRKYGLPPNIRAPPTTSTTLASTTPSSDGSSVPPSSHTQEFVMISNPGYHNPEPQPSFP